MHQLTDSTLAFGPLPAELLLNVIEHLAGIHNYHKSIAYAPSNAITKALRALTLVSRTCYLLASKYLYTHCLYLHTCTNFSQLRRTLGLGSGPLPQALRYGEAGRNDALFHAAQIRITNAFIAPMQTQACEEIRMTMVRLPQIIDLGLTIGPTLKRLALDMNPVYATPSEIFRIKPHLATNNIFLRMPNLYELICSFDTVDCFPVPPPNLRRLAITSHGLGDEAVAGFCFAISSLEYLACIRGEDLSGRDIDDIFNRYKGHGLDVLLVDLNNNHVTPPGVRNWTEEDKVRIWEVDVPTSFYGDEDDITLSDGWIWTQGVKGSLWEADRRRMRDQRDLDRLLETSPS
ncbi:hypothetical protein DM02DRAFT_589803 [Periconia macrospinosa]|uniref:Uncharacterized protein n=1 Tax=Periconia macrospinosa TaxID=97972 RepID=A0A2V1DVM0_9PLEO|nr:hypothetical protein DM02DRAFT_589803 [Periconia macrospinosa]